MKRQISFIYILFLHWLLFCIAFRLRPVLAKKTVVCRFFHFNIYERMLWTFDDYFKNHCTFAPGCYWMRNLRGCASARDLNARNGGSAILCKKSYFMKDKMSSTRDSDLKTSRRICSSCAFFGIGRGLQFISLPAFAMASNVSKIGWALCSVMGKNLTRGSPLSRCMN